MEAFLPNYIKLWDVVKKMSITRYSEGIAVTSVPFVPAVRVTTQASCQLSVKSTISTCIPATAPLPHKIGYTTTTFMLLIKEA